MDKQKKIADKNERIRLAREEKEQEDQFIFKLKKCITCSNKKKKHG